MDITFTTYADSHGTAQLHVPTRVRAAASANALALLSVPTTLAATGSARAGGTATLHPAPPRLRASAKGNIALLRLPLTTLATASTVLPKLVLGRLRTRPTVVYARGTQVATGSATLVLTPSHLLATGSKGARAATSQGGAALLRTTTSVLALPAFAFDNTVSLVPDLTMLITAQEPDGILQVLTTGLGVGGSPRVALLTYRLQSVLALHGAVNPASEIARQLQTTIGLTAVVELALYLRAQTGLGVHATPTDYETLLLVLADTLAILGRATSLQEADALLATIFALADTTDTPLAELLQSGLGVHSALTADITAYAMALSAMRVAAALTGTLTLTAVLSDTLGLTDEITTVVELMRIITSTIGVSVTLSLGDEVYGAWVMDAASKAAWSYTNFPFNSFAQLGERFLGAGPDGIYELSGPDDDGTPIDWSVRTGLLNFGTMAEKRIDTAYIGYTSTGAIGLSVITTAPGGEKVQYNYILTPRTANAPRENRIKVGRGLKSVYFAFEMAGTGAFALHDMQLLPMVLGRRI